MPFIRRCLGAALVAVPLVLVACGGDHDEDSEKPSSSAAKVGLAGRDTNRVLGPGDVKIVSTDTSVEISLVGDTVLAGFGKKVLDQIKDKTDTAKVSGDGLGASIEKMVKKTVADAMGHQIVIPVSEIDDVRYEDGGLRFYGKDGKKMHLFENSHNGKEETPAAFSQADANRFITAFKARKAHTA